MPVTDRVVVEADGGSRGNPGVAGYGAVVFDAHTGRVLVERAAPLGKQSNNVAEYQGLIAGLDAAAAVAPGAVVDVRMDSKLVIEQMAGRWKVKHEDMRRLSLEAAAIVRRIRAAGGSVTWTWIPRERNKKADKLSNDGMDGRTIDTLPAALGRAGAPKPPVVPEPPEPPEPPEQAHFASPAPVSAPPPEPTLTGATRVLLVRHGATDFTEQGRLDGRGGADPGLNREGRRQAQATAQALRGLVVGPVRLVTSALARARQTGAAVGGALGVEPVVDDGWDERAFGDWDGERLGDLSARDPEEVRRLLAARDHHRPGGESMAQVEDRVLNAYGRVVSGGGTVVVVTSRTPVVVVLGTVLGMPSDRFRALVTDPASVSAVEVWPDGNASVPFVNRTAHLG
ncbi:MAG: bifunctional RNase H/acid phosphatase [Lapillicoccus sp.]